MVDSVQPDILDIVPEHVAEPVRRPPWRTRAAAAGREALLSLLLNGAVVVGLVGVGFPLRSNTSPDAISVELVPHMPGPGTGQGAKGAEAGGSAPSKQAKVADAEAHQAAAQAPEELQPPEPPATPAPQPTPKAVAEEQPAPEPPAEPASPEPAPAPAVDPAAAAQKAVPPPPEHPDADPRPHLVEAPSAPPTTEPVPQPQPASGTPEPAQPAAAEQPKPSSPSAAPEAASPAQRPVQSAAESEEEVATPAPRPEAPKPLTAEERRQAANTATLAAMLPFGGGIAANPFTAQSPVAGQGTSTAYRGQVYANFNKAQDIIADAKARHLKGQAVVAFTIDDRGNIASLGIAVSSKNPEVDQAALDLIRRAAPFPPPPPGAQRSFAPAIGLGLDD